MFQRACGFLLLVIALLSVECPQIRNQKITLMNTKTNALEMALRSQIQVSNSFGSSGQSLRKMAVLLLLSTIAFTQAAIVRFDLSPPGTDVAVGLSPSNETGGVINSTGSGNEISAGISFDTISSTLSLAIGYGSAAGFTDLTGPATGLHIHGPAGAGTNAGVLINLGPFHFVAANPAQGGVIVGSVAYPSNEIANLFAGLNYVNIHTATNPGGEIRGQLIPLANVAPEIICPAAATVECSVQSTFTATVSDADGEPVQVVWKLNGTAVQTNNIAAGGPPTSALVAFSATLPLGTNTLELTVTDSSTNSTTCSTIITVVDTIPPVIVSASATPNVLWPPNHKMVTVPVQAVVTDACGATTWRIISVSSSESVNAKGTGNTAPDWRITGPHTVQLRAERAGGNRNGRVYTITIQATDAAGNLSSTSTVLVTVPHSQAN
ncbi:MAG TPA: CHRD domain-containing protein [Vicinamibacterales bacterium]|nr:CHRD domain-containing protein [Vicinamibacterales bacterium]